MHLVYVHQQKGIGTMLLVPE